MSDNERRKYQDDVAFEAWCRGLDPDIAHDRAYDDWWEGYDVDESVDAYQRHEQPPQEPTDDHES